MENNQESKRAQFEAWFDSLHDIKHPRWFDRVSDDRRYCSMEVEYAWLAWCASPAVAAVPDLSGLTRYGLKNDIDGAPYVGPRENGSFYEAAEVQSLLSQQGQNQQGQGEPVAWMRRHDHAHVTFTTDLNAVARWEALGHPLTPVYTAPVPPVTAPAGVSELTAGQERTEQWFKDAIKAYATLHDEADLKRIERGLHELIAKSAGVSESQVRDAALEEAALLVETNDLNSAAFNASEIRALKSATPTVSPASQTEGKANG